MLIVFLAVRLTKLLRNESAYVELRSLFDANFEITLIISASGTFFYDRLFFFVLGQMILNNHHCSLNVAGVDDE